MIHECYDRRHFDSMFYSEFDHVREDFIKSLPERGNEFFVTHQRGEYVIFADSENDVKKHFGKGLIEIYLYD